MASGSIVCHKSSVSSENNWISSGSSDFAHRKIDVFDPEGIVNLLAVVRPNIQYIRIANLCGKSLHHRSARHGFPSLEGLDA
ncbi:hypothetical protein OKW42_003423 [Paraburkholderia sp. WC7.3d]